MRYHDSLWAQAPEGATHWGVFECTDHHRNGESVFVMLEADGYYSIWNGEQEGAILYPGNHFSDLHPRPASYQSAVQLIEDYRKEHGAEIEELVRQFYHEPLENERDADIGDVVRESAFHVALLEKLLVAERARIGADAAKKRKE